MSCIQARYINICKKPEVTENVINRSTEDNSIQLW